MIRVPGGAAVLRALVDFIYTDHCALALLKRAELEALADLSARYQLPGLAAHLHRRLDPVCSPLPDDAGLVEADPASTDPSEVRPCPASCTLPTLQGDILTLLEHATLTDVVLWSPSGGFEVATCRSVLAARSEYFRQLFRCVLTGACGGRTEGEGGGDHQVMEGAYCTNVHNTCYYTNK